MKQMAPSTSHRWQAGLLLALIPGLSQAAGDAIHLENFTAHWAGLLAVGIFRFLSARDR